MSGKTKSGTRTKRWLMAFLASACVCLVWFAYTNRDGCLLYWQRLSAIVPFLFPLVWMTLLFGLGMKGRAVLVALTVVGVLLLPHVDVSHVAAAEASAVGRLRKTKDSLAESALRNRSYPETAPNLSATFPVERFYSFEYEPVYSSDGKVGSYILKAIPFPKARTCGCSRSFAMTNDGRIYYTLENRAATTADKELE